MRKILKKDRDRFTKVVKDIVFNANPTAFKPREFGTEYEFAGENTLLLTVMEADQQEYLFSVFSRFDKFVPELDMNPYSFKYNFHSDLPVDTAIDHFKDWFKRALPHVGQQTEQLINLN